MISLIIFSKNRACQLQLLLESIEKNSNNIFDTKTVIFEATTKDFRAGYDLLIERFGMNTLFIAETDFQKNTISAINNSCKYICFMVDDNILYGTIPFDHGHITYTLSNEFISSLSLRLGTNIKYDDIYNDKITLYPEHVGIITYDSYIDEEIRVWDWRTLPPHSNFGYPFSVDGNIYKKQELLDFIDYEFDTPNSFEGRFDRHKLRQLMCCFNKSVLVNNPINLVGSSNNNAGKYYGWSLEDLNNKYLSGKVIDLDNILSNNIVACHQEMEILFK